MILTMRKIQKQSIIKTVLSIQGLSTKITLVQNLNSTGQPHKEDIEGFCCCWLRLAKSDQIFYIIKDLRRECNPPFPLSAVCTPPPHTHTYKRKVKEMNYIIRKLLFKILLQ